MKSRNQIGFFLFFAILCITLITCSFKVTHATSASVSVKWYYIHCEETHDNIGKGEFYIYIRWKHNGVYNYHTFPIVQLAAGENNYPDTSYIIDTADYPGSIGVQLWESDWGADDLIIDWRNTNIPSQGGHTFSWWYESPPGGCYIRIDIWHNTT
ncbi:MAG: hypothetical protein ACTSSG_03645 [Candidatus Heimdallarchaeaceae archaeon]